MTERDVRLWHPWLSIIRILRVMLHNTLERRGVAAGQGRVQEGARVAERDPARGVVQLCS